MADLNDFIKQFKSVKINEVQTGYAEDIVYRMLKAMIGEPAVHAIPDAQRDDLLRKWAGLMQTHYQTIRKAEKLSTTEGAERTVPAFWDRMCEDPEIRRLADGG